MIVNRQPRLPIYNALKKRMLQFARKFNEFQIVSTLSTQLSWSAFLEVLPLEDPLAREFYVTMAAAERWSVRKLRDQMGAMLYERTLISRKPEETIRAELSTVRQSGSITVLDDYVRKPHENPSVGLVLCKSADKSIVEYLIKDYNKPMGAATFRTSEEMPEKFRKALPDIEELKKLL